MNIKCRICQFFDWLPVILIAAITIFSIWYLFSGVYSQIYDAAQGMGEVLPFALLAWLSIGWLFIVGYLVLAFAGDELLRTLSKWRQECKDETEETTP